jgi:hypothetical protein
MNRVELTAQGGEDGVPTVRVVTEPLGSAGNITGPTFVRHPVGG